MEQLWPVWSNNLGLTNSTPELISATYPAQLWPFNGTTTLGNSVAAGVTSLLNLVNSTYTAGERLIVWGISQGSLVIDQTQTLLTATRGAPPPDAITFVRVADPAAALTGVFAVNYTVQSPAPFSGQASILTYFYQPPNTGSTP